MVHVGKRIHTTFSIGLYHKEEPHKYYTMCGSVLQATCEKEKGKDGHNIVGKILEALAKDNLCIIPATEKRNPEHQKACEISYSLIEQLNEQLVSENQRLFNEVIEAMEAESCLEAESRFIRGFCLGARIFMEIMEERESFLLDDADRE